ncbi:helix-turn-helix domain-containing protein [Streptomyces sp. NPDC006195]|uniref:helix-turn-helix domain-containing protein n=1 Tax=unclassified Streptomyces TaxID=2593676 RepID=UPI0033A19077
MQADGELAADDPGAVHEHFHDNPATSFIRSFDSNERIVRTYGPIRHPVQILGAAEHLFAERGYRGTSVRAITDLAGANPAAVG